MNYVVKIHRSCQNGWKTLNKTAQSSKSQKAGNAKRPLNRLTKFSVLLKFSGNSYTSMRYSPMNNNNLFPEAQKKHKIHCTISLLSLSLTNNILVLFGIVSCDHEIFCSNNAVEIHWGYLSSLYHSLIPETTESCITHWTLIKCGAYLWHSSDTQQ